MLGQPPSRIRAKASRNPSGVRTTPFSSRQPSTSPLRFSGASTSEAILPAASSTAPVKSGVSSS